MNENCWSFSLQFYLYEKLSGWLVYEDFDIFINQIVLQLRKYII